MFVEERKKRNISVGCIKESGLGTPSKIGYLNEHMIAINEIGISLKRSVATSFDNFEICSIKVAVG